MYRTVAVAIFYDKDLNILMQIRGKYAKSGEKYGFWGGGFEEGESPEQAIKRELIEELNFTPKEITYLGPYSFVLTTTGETHHGEIFLSPITDELLNSDVIEGEGKSLVPLDVLIENKNKEIGPVTTDFLIPVKSSLQEIVSK